MNEYPEFWDTVGRPDDLRSSEEFERWMVAVDSEIAKRFGGFTSGDLVDQPYRDWFNDEIAPSEAARMAIRDGI